jgi:hypothetical protein
VLLAWATSLAACGGDDTASDSGADATGGGAETSSGEAGATICDEFTEAGAPCLGPSALRCFPLCDTGGYYCRATPGGGAHWVCVTDTTCLPDCAPIDEACMSAGGE